MSNKKSWCRFLMLAILIIVLVTFFVMHYTNLSEDNNSKLIIEILLLGAVTVRYRFAYQYTVIYYLKTLTHTIVNLNGLPMTSVDQLIQNPSFA